MQEHHRFATAHVDVGHAGTANGHAGVVIGILRADIRLCHPGHAT